MFSISAIFLLRKPSNFLTNIILLFVLGKLVTGISAGTATITCTAKDGSGKYATCSVSVMNEDVVTLNSTNANVTNGVLTLKYKLNNKKIIIPSTINGQTITSIGANAFYDCDRLSTVTIASGVRSIGSNAFYDCDALSAVKLIMELKV